MSDGLTGQVPIAITLGSTGAGTASTPFPVKGMVVQVRIPTAGTAPLGGGSATMLFTRRGDGGTILSLTAVAAVTQSFQPSMPYHTLAGVLAGTSSFPGVPVDDQVNLVMTQGSASTAGTVYLHII